MAWTPEQRKKYGPRSAPVPKEKLQGYHRRYYAKAENRAKSIYRSWVRQIKLLGCSEAQYWQLHAEQNGVCAICLRANPNGRRLAVDHCHKTSIVRGLLCQACNPALGLFQENPVVLDRAKEYLCRSTR